MAQSICVVLGVVLWVLALLVCVTYLLPCTVALKRHVRVERPPDVVFSWLNEARNWPRWFPWGGPGGPEAATYEGPRASKGATRKWEGTSGARGHQVLVDADPPNYLRMSVHVGRYGPGQIEWSIEPDGDSVSQITCVLDLEVGTSLRRRWQGVFLRDEIAEDLDEGLHSLKEVVEATAETP